MDRAHLNNPIDVARDGQQTFDYLFGTEQRAPRPVPALVLLDLKLPRVDGLEILRRIRAEERTSRLLVVILTSSNEDHALATGYDLGANSPIQFDKFASRAARLGVYWLTLNEPAPSS